VDGSFQLHFDKPHHQDPNQRCRESRNHVRRVVHAEVDARKTDRQKHQRRHNPYRRTNPLGLDARREYGGERAEEDGARE